MILDHLDNELRYVSNQRRKDITLQDYLSNHHDTRGNGLVSLSDDILKSKVENMFGQFEASFKDRSYVKDL
jgi:hypothetical protein